MDDRAFVTLKSKLCNVTDLCIPTCSDVYVMYTDGSVTEVSAVRDGEEKPVSFFSKQLQWAQCRYSATELEGLAIYFYYALCTSIVWEALYY